MSKMWGLIQTLQDMRDLVRVPVVLALEDSCNYPAPPHTHTHMHTLPSSKNLHDRGHHSLAAQLLGKGLSLPCCFS